MTENFAAKQCLPENNYLLVPLAFAPPPCSYRGLAMIPSMTNGKKYQKNTKLFLNDQNIYGSQMTQIGPKGSKGKENDILV